MSEHKEELDTLWAQLSSLATGLHTVHKKLGEITTKITKINQRLERLEDRVILSPVRITIEFENKKDAEEFKEYIKDQKDVAIPNSDRMQDDKFIPARLVED